MKWLTPGGAEMSEQDWNFPDGRFLSYVLAPAKAISGAPLYIVLNGAERADGDHAAGVAGDAAAG